MSTSDVRRGPGWWMDLEGGWNPPEEWPEPTPPLPGWAHNDDGSWRPPVDETGAVREPSPHEVEADSQLPGNESSLRATAQEPAHRAPLRYVEHIRHHVPHERDTDRTTARKALNAAALAAITASMIAGGMVLLLLLL